MHVPVMHRFPDATGVAFALMACSRIHCLQLYLIIVLTKSILSEQEFCILSEQEFCNLKISNFI